jgi:hypothetical protein
MTTSSDAAREALRREHGVRLVTPDEEGFAAGRLPGAIYGFTSSPALASPLFAARRYRNFEIHRLANGVIAVIGFVIPADAAKLTDASGARPVTVTIYPDLDGEATAIVSLPYHRIVQHRQYSIPGAAAITVQVTPALDPASV